MALAGSLFIEMSSNVARITTDMNATKQIVGSAMKSVESAVASAKSALGALGIGLSVGALASYTKGSIDAADHLNDLSKTTAIAVEQLAGLTLAAKQTGGDLDSIATSISKLSVNMGKDAEKFKALGISAKDPLEAFKQLSDLFKNIIDPQQRAAVMAAALGKAWAGAAPLLAEGSKNIQEMVDKGAKLSGMTKEMAEAADAFNDKVAELGTAFGATKNQIASGLLPTLTALVDNFTLVRNIIASVVAAKFAGWAAQAAAALYTTVSANMAAAAATLATANANVVTTGATVALTTARVAELRAAVLAAEGEAILAVTMNGLIPMQAKAAAASAAHAIALDAQAVAARAASVSSGLASSALGLLGGPIGWITLLLGLGATAWAIWGRSSKDATEQAKDSVARGLEIVQRLNKEAKFGTGDIGNLNIALDAAKVRIADLKAKGIAVDSSSFKTAQINAFMLEAAIEQLKTKTVVMTEAQRKAAEAVAEFLENNNKGAKTTVDAYAKIQDAADKYIATLLKEADQLGMTDKAKAMYNMTTVAMTLNAGKERDSFIAVATALIDQVDAYKKAVVIATERAALRKKESDGIEAYMRAQTEGYAAAVKGSQDAVTAAKIEYEQLGLSKTQIAEITLLKLQEMQVSGKGGIEAVAAREKEIAAQKELIGWLQKIDIKQTGIDAPKNAAAEWRNLGNDISDSLTKAFGNAGKAAGDMFKEYAHSMANQIKIDATYASDSKALADKEFLSFHNMTEDKEKLAAQYNADTYRTDESYIAAKKNIDDRGKEDYGRYLDAQEALDAEYANKSIQNTLTQYGSMAGAAASFFDQQSTAYKVLHGIEEAMFAAKLVMQIQSFAASMVISKASQAEDEKSTISSVIAGAAKFFAQSGWAGFVGVAAMIAVIASLGGKSGGSAAAPTMPAMGQDAATNQQLQGTGTILGDSSAKSDSIQKSLDLLAKNSDITLPQTNAMLLALEKIRDSIQGMASAIAQSTGLLGRPGDTSGLDLGRGYNLGGTLGNLLLGPGFSTTELTDQGITLSPQTIRDIRGSGVSATGYSATTTSNHIPADFLGLFDNSSNNTIYAPLADSVKKQLSLTILSIANGVEVAATALGKGGAEFNARLEALNVDLGLISLKGLTGQALTDALNAVFSNYADTLAQTMLPGLDAFEVVGESYFQTVIRVATGIETANSALSHLGITAIDYTAIINKQGDVMTEISRQSIVAAESTTHQVANPYASVPNGIKDLLGLSHALTTTVVDSVTGIGKIIDGFTGSGPDLITLYTTLIGIRHEMSSLGLAAADVTLTMVTAAGGVSELQAGVQAYYDKFFTDTQHQVMMGNDQAAVFSKLGVAMPTTNAGFVALVNGIDRTTEAGQALFGSLMADSGAFAAWTAAYETAMSSAKKTADSLAVQLLTAQGNDAGALTLQRTQELAAATAGLSATQAMAVALAMTANYATQDQITVELAHQQTLATNVGLQSQLNDLKDLAAGKTQIEIDRANTLAGMTDATTISLQNQIYAQQDLAAAAAAAAAATSTATASIASLMGKYGPQPTVASATADIASTLGQDPAVIAAMSGTQIHDWFAGLVAGASALDMTDPSIQNWIALLAKVAPSVDLLTTSLVAVGDTVVAVDTVLQGLTNTNASLTDQYNKLTMSAAQYRDFQIVGMTTAQIAMYDSNAAIQANIDAYNAQTTAASAAAQAEVARLAAIASERTGLQNQLDQLTMTSAELLDKQRSALDASNQALFDQVTAAQAATKAAADLASAQAALASTNKGLQNQLDVLTGAQTDRTIALRDATDDSTRALLNQIYAQQDLATAATEANKSADALAASTAAIAATNKGWQDQLDVLMGTQTARSIALRDAADPSTRALMEQVYALQDLQTAATASAAATLAAADAAAALAKTNQGVQDQIDVLTGTQTARSLALRDATDESTRALLRQLYAQQDLTTATDAATAAAQALAKTNQGWQDQLDVLTGISTVRAQQLRDAGDETTRSLMQQVWAQQDLQAATAASSSAMQTFIDNVMGLVSGIHTSVTDSIFNMNYGLADSAGKYGMLDQQAAGYDAAMRGATDINVIAKNAQLEIDTINRAFGLLDPTQQAATLAANTLLLTKVDSFVTGAGADAISLKKADNQALSDAVAAAVEKALKDLAQKMTDAAIAQAAAASKIEDVIREPAQVNVNVTKAAGTEVSVS